MREEEEAALAAAGEPMRNYLVHHIFPTLTPALLEVAKLRPDDPIDFLVCFYYYIWMVFILFISCDRPLLVSEPLVPSAPKDGDTNQDKHRYLGRYMG